jgi:hypothetical protein
MFARYNYRFKTNTWNEFLKKYYNNDYSGTRSSEEITLAMTEYEKNNIRLDNKNRATIRQTNAA